MKKTLFAFMALAATFAATSCQSDEEFAQQPTNKPMVINAVAEGIGTGTRAEMKYKYDIVWSVSDQIYVAGNSKNATFTLKSGENTTNGTFECESSPFTSGDAVEAFYPASLVAGESLVWPAEQTTSTVIPMYSKQTLGSTGTENFSFASLGAMLQIVFTTSQADVTLKSITIKDDDATMSGTFTVDENGKAGITATDKAGITLDLGTGVGVGLAAKYFNIAVPAGTYSKLSITFTATDNRICTFTGSNVTINHNTVSRLTLTGTKFKHIGIKGTEKATIDGDDVDVNWVQLWDNGPKFAEYNIGATSATEYDGYYTWGGTHKNGKDIPWVYDQNTGSVALSGTDDTATNLWGGNWRMPTKEEFDNLLAKCDVEWIDGDTKKYNNTTVTGLLCTGKDAYSSNSVFLPAAGTCFYSVDNQGSRGYYWSSTPGGRDFAYGLVFYFDGQFVQEYGCAEGRSVRAVLAEQ